MLKWHSLLKCGGSGARSNLIFYYIFQVWSSLFVIVDNPFLRQATQSSKEIDTNVLLLLHWFLVWKKVNHCAVDAFEKMARHYWSSWKPSARYWKKKELPKSVAQPVRSMRLSDKFCFDCNCKVLRTSLSTTTDGSYEAFVHHSPVVLSPQCS